MTGRKVNILSTRPLGNLMKQTALDHNIAIDELSFISTASIKDDQLDAQIFALSAKKATVIFTSMNAVNAVSKHIGKKTSWRIYCIGNTTRLAVENIFSKESIAGTAANAQLLANKIIEDAQAKEVVFFCGNLRRDELPVQLKQGGVEVKEVIVYETTSKPHTVLKQYDGILFFSPSAVNAFFNSNTIAPNTQIFAIGATTAAAAGLHTSNKVIIPPSPDKKMLAVAMIEHFSRPKN